MKKEIKSILFFLVAALFYVAAIIGFAGKTQNPMSFFWLCMGSVFLCIGSSRSKKTNRDETDPDEKE